MYDALGRRTATTDPAGNVTQYQYDALGRLASVTTPGGHTETFGYDELGEKIRQADASGHVTRFAYDLRGHLVWHQLPKGQSETFAYDADGRLASHTDFNGLTTLSLYSATTGRLNGKTANSLTAPLTYNPVVAFTYNPDGTRATATRYSAPNSGGAVTTTDSYYGPGTPSQGQLASVTTTLPSGTLGSLTYTYDDAGNKLSATTPSGTTGYTYDADNRLSTVSMGGSLVASYAYDKNGNRETLTRGNGVTTAYTYDKLNRLTRLVNSAGSSYQYTLRADGKRLSVTDSTGTTNYTYDGDGRLTAESGPYGSIAYTYDAVGNRLSKTVSGSTYPSTLPNGATSYTFDADDRITSETLPSGSSVTHTYDGNGNETTVSGQTATYDWQNKLVSLGSTASYLYDADGNKVSETSGTTTTASLVDTSLAYPSVVAEYVGGSGTPSATYVYGDDLISTTQGGGTSYYVFDGLGSTRALTGAGGNVTDTYVYDAFGELVSHSGGSGNEFLFDAQQFDGATGDYYLRARFYNQADGRFLSQDPYSGSNEDPISLHRYLYAGNDPIDMVDPGGEDFGLGDTLVSTSIANSIAS